MAGKLSALPMITSASGGYLEILVGGVNYRIKTADLAASIATSVGNLPWINVQEPPYNAVGDGVTDDSAAIQGALDDVPSEGGRVYAPPAHYFCGTGLHANVLGTEFVTDGIPGVSSEYGQGTTVIIVGDGEVGLTVGSASSTTFKGFGMSGFMFREKNVGQAAGGFKMLRTSDSWLDHVAFGQFTSGIDAELDGTGDVNQYTQFSDVRFGKAATGLSLKRINGLRLIGCNFDGNRNGGDAILSGSTAIKIDDFSDTLRAEATVLQGYDILADIGGFYHHMQGCRFEIFGTDAVRFRASSLMCHVDGSVNNYIVSTAAGHNVGTAAVVAAGATDCEIDLTATDVATFLTDAGTRTRVAGVLGKQVSASSISGHTIVGKVPYIVNGTIIGWQPIYDAIT